MFEKVLQITSKGIHHFINIIYYWRVNDVKRHLRYHVEICNAIFKPGVFLSVMNRRSSSRQIINCSATD